MLPGAIGSGVYQLNLVIDMWFASLLPEGAVSYLFYADRLNQLPLGIIGIAIGTGTDGIDLEKESISVIEKRIHENHDEVVDFESRVVGELSRDDSGWITITTQDAEVQAIVIEKDLDLGLFCRLRLRSWLLLEQAADGRQPCRDSR